MQRIYSFGDIEVHPAERRLRVGERLVPLGGRAFDLLVTLLQRAGSLVSKDDLLDAVWGDTVVEEANLHVHVSTLRKALGPGVIDTVPGRGYRFALLPPSAPAAGGAAVPSIAASAPLPLIGRDADLAALSALLARHRLVTVTGAGGIGKTRLAAAALWNARGDFVDGAATVELASLADPALIPVAIATALELPAGGGLPGLLAAARPLEALVLLDNAEHLVEVVAAIVAALAEAAPSLHLLVTSQVPLRLARERVVRLGALVMPPAGVSIDAAQALAYGAVALFDDRLQAADRRLRVDDDNLGAVLEICRRLDGIALAIELAAARCPVLGVRGVAERLDERFRLLRVHSRSAPSRQQTLGAAMTFSHGLLSAPQQAAFRQLGVFSGSFTLAMAMRVVRVEGFDEIDRIDLLGELVDRSLVAVDVTEPPRYRLLESGRLFALDKLAESGESAVVRLRHVQAVRDHFDAAWDASWLLPEDAFVDRYEADLDNLRAALDEALPRDAHAAIALAGAGTRLWRRLSLHPEAIRRCQDAAALIDAETPLALEARLWEGMAQLTGEVSLAESRTAGRRAVDLYERLGDARGRYLALAHIAFSHRVNQGVAPEAVAAFEEMRRIEDPAWPPSVRLYGRKVEGGLASDAGRLEASRIATRARLELATECGSQRDVNAALGNLADLALLTGDADEAVRLGRSLLTRLRRRDAATRAIALGNLLNALLVQGADAEARETAGDVVQSMRQMDFLFQVSVGDAFALLAARESRFRAAGLLIGFSDAHYASQDSTREGNEARARQSAGELLAAHVDPGQIADWAAEGALLGTAAACTLALERPDATP